jgi:hypothetical protein
MGGEPLAYHSSSSFKPIFIYQALNGEYLVVFLFRVVARNQQVSTHGVLAFPQPYGSRNAFTLSHSWEYDKSIAFFCERLRD